MMKHPFRKGPSAHKEIRAHFLPLCYKRLGKLAALRLNVYFEAKYMKVIKLDEGPARCIAERATRTFTCASVDKY